MYRPRPHVAGRAQLQRCQSDAHWWRNYAALARFARPTHLPPFHRQNKRRLWPRREYFLAQIPQQRAVPQGAPPRPRFSLPRR